MPTKKPYVKYSKGQYQLKVPFAMYVDFESLLTKPSEEEKKRGIVNVHEPSGWCVKSEFTYGEVDNPIKIYSGKDSIEKFCKHIVSKAKRLHRSFPEKPMEPLTSKQIKAHSEAKVCHICLEGFKIKDRKVRDHCHYTGKYRGATHSNCNLQYKIPGHIPMIFHNPSGYNTHLFIRELSKHKSIMGVIAKNKVYYISFSIKVKVGTKIDKNGIEVPVEVDLRFINSFRFMSSSLDSLVNNLNKGGHKFRGFMGYTRKQRSLLVRKGVYPYEYIDSWSKFEEDRLQSIDDFYSKLNMSGISDDNYEHAKRVWVKELRRVPRLVLKTDVILLSNIFEKFKKVSMENYGSDPTHFCTAPGLAWQACLKKTGMKLDLITDPDMLLMFERGIRGGITQIVKRYAKANNKYMNDYDRK